MHLGLHDPADKLSVTVRKNVLELEVGGCRAETVRTPDAGAAVRADAEILPLVFRGLPSTPLVRSSTCATRHTGEFTSSPLTGFRGLLKWLPDDVLLAFVLDDLIIRPEWARVFQKSHRIAGVSGRRLPSHSSSNCLQPASVHAPLW